MNEYDFQEMGVEGKCKFSLIVLPFNVNLLQKFTTLLNYAQSIQVRCQITANIPSHIGLPKKLKWYYMFAASFVEFEP